MQTIVRDLLEIFTSASTHSFYFFSRYHVSIETHALRFLFSPRLPSSPPHLSLGRACV
jgi:hypothetical protein